MRSSLIPLLLCLSLTLSGATYYVSPGGSDSNSGTLSQPFFTLNKAWTVISAGDIVYMRGGTYSYNTTMTSLQDKSGTSGSYIKIWAYPGENPVIDYSGVAFTSQEMGMHLHNINYVHFKGIRISNLKQINTGDSPPHYGIILYNEVSNCIFEMMEIDHIGGMGVVIADDCNNNLFLNCDSHHNQDPYSSNPYGGSDGFETGSHTPGHTSTNNVFRGCRAWSNSDDGWDLRQADGVYKIENCWSFWNGYVPGTFDAAGNGEGFKLGGKTAPATTSILRTITNSLAFQNRTTGFTPEPDGPDLQLGTAVYNCTAFDNEAGFVFNCYNNTDVVKNNISYSNSQDDWRSNTNTIHDHNSFDLSVNVTNADFVSLDPTGVDGPRQSDGSLPEINFLKLASGSDLIDAGVDVGVPYSGNAPDLGAFEMQSGSTVTTPVYSSSAVENSTPSILGMIYNTTLANVVPAASAFSVRVNSVARTVGSVAISGTKVLLTLASPIVYGDVVTVAYSKPASNPLQTTSGGQAVTITAQSVTNKVNSANLVYVSSAIENTTPSLLEMTYNLTLASVVPAASAFSVRVNSVARTVSTVAISGAKVLLTLASPIVYGDVVTVAYSKPSSNPLQTASGGQAVTIAAQVVTNKVNSVDPIYVSSAIANATPSLLEMTYSLTLANIIPASSAFSVRVNSVNRAVNTVAISGKKVLLTLASPIVFGNVVTISYTKPSTNQLQTSSVGIAANITNQPVINNRINVAPTVLITSPGNNSSFKAIANITITASASDTDGSISKVEFYNGNTKIGEKAIAPYSYTWNNVPLGTYAITAVATDNLNKKTTSSLISISVNNGTPVLNTPPIVSISNPIKGNKYEKLATITIDAIASDPDGTIRKVEFYSGANKLAELTSAPYSYTWKNVAIGTYSITAIATDNLNATSTSSTIEFIVEAGSRYDANSEIINLYPNPSDGHFSIELINPLQTEKSEIVISDLAGKKVFQEPLLREEIIKQFDLSDIKPGIYIMMIIGKEILVTKKFIKN